MLGKDIFKQMIEEGYEVFVVNRNIDSQVSSRHSIICDISNIESFTQVLKTIRPMIVIHCAAMVDIEYCENNPENAIKINYNPIKTIIDNLVNNAKLIFISTDSVFDSSKSSKRENDKKNPINIYSKTKSDAEDLICRSMDNFVIVRCNIYGFHLNWRGSLAEWAIVKLIQGREFAGYDNVIFNPLYTRQVAAYLSRILYTNFNGVIHLGSEKPISKYEFIIQLGNALKLPISKVLKSSLIEGIWAPRHHNTSLNIDYSRELFPEIDHSLEYGLTLFKSDLEDYYGNYKNWIRYNKS